MKHTETKKKGNLSLLPFIWVGYSSSSSTLLNRFHLILNTKYTDLILCSLSVLSIFYTSNAICYEWNASSIRWHMDTLRRLRTVEMMQKKKTSSKKRMQKKELKRNVFDYRSKLWNAHPSISHSRCLLLFTNFGSAHPDPAFILAARIITMNAGHSNSMNNERNAPKIETICDAVSASCDLCRIEWIQTLRWSKGSDFAMRT